MQIDDFEGVIRWRSIAEDFSVVTVHGKACRIQLVNNPAAVRFLLPSPQFLAAVATLECSHFVSMNRPPYPALLMMWSMFPYFTRPQSGSHGARHYDCPR